MRERAGSFRNILLLAASLLFYAWGEPRYMWLLLVSILANYALGLFMDGIQGQGRRKFILIAGILVNLGILGYYKYFNFFINTLNKIFGRGAIVNEGHCPAFRSVSFLPSRL